MLGTIFRLAMLASTGAGMAAGFRNAMVKFAALFVAALAVGLILAVAVATFGFAIYVALAPQVGAAWAAAAAGLLLIVIAAVLALACRTFYLRRSRPVASSAAGLGGPLGAAALGASMGAGPSLDLKGALGRNALTVLLAAFIAGMVMTNRR